MKKEDAEALYRDLAPRVFEVYLEGVATHPDVELMVLHVPGEADFPLPFPLADFRETLKGRMPDLLQIIDAGIPSGSFWFALVEGDLTGTSIFVRAVHPSIFVRAAVDPSRLN